MAKKKGKDSQRERRIRTTKVTPLIRLKFAIINQAHNNPEEYNHEITRQYEGFENRRGTFKVGNQKYSYWIQRIAKNTTGLNGLSVQLRKSLNPKQVSVREAEAIRKIMFPTVLAEEELEEAPDILKQIIERNPDLNK